MTGYDGRYAGPALSLLRMVAALLILLHGTSKLFGFPPFPMALPATGSLLWFGAVLELIGGALLLVGLASRPVAFILSGEMAVAYWMVHAPQGIFPSVNMGEAAILFCFICLAIAAAGPGPWSLDEILRRNRSDVEGYAAPGGERQYSPEDFGEKSI